MSGIYLYSMLEAIQLRIYEKQRSSTTQNAVPLRRLCNTHTLKLLRPRWWVLTSTNTESTCGHADGIRDRDQKHLRPLQTMCYTFYRKHAILSASVFAVTNIKNMLRQDPKKHLRWHHYMCNSKISQLLTTPS